MTWRYKILGGLLLLLLVSASALALALSYNAPCAAVPAVPTDTTTIKAVLYRCYGTPDVLELRDVVKPEPADDEVLVQVHAAAVNPLDWHYMRGSPYVMRIGTGIGTPKNPRIGVDFAGIVEAAGKNVTRFKVGDQVFGGRTGAFADYVSVRADGALALKPPNMSFGQAAGVPIAGITALQALRDKGKLRAGEKVLINGASGGVGTFAVQIAKAYGAEVTGVCSTRNVEMIRSLGADHVFDYTREDYTESDRRFDLIIDNVGNHSLLANRRVLADDGILVIVGAPKGNWIRPLMRPIKAMLLSPFVSQDFIMILAQLTAEDLATLADLMQSGKVTPVIDRSYGLDEVRDAVRYSEQGHARGKILVTVR